MASLRAALVLAIVAIRVLRVGATAFEAVMMAAGESAEHAQRRIGGRGRPGEGVKRAARRRGLSLIHISEPTRPY